MSSSHQVPETVIVGFGNQARLWARLLMNAGVAPKIFLRSKSPSIARAIQDGFDVVSSCRDISDGAVWALLIPDMEIGPFLRANLPDMPKQGHFVLAHGLAYEVFKDLWPQAYNRLLLAPKGIASELEKRALGGQPNPACVAVNHQSFGDPQAVLDALCAKMGFASFQGSVSEEVRADLFSEQSVLCGGLIFLLKESFERLVRSGVNPKLAYLEVFYESSLMLQAYLEHGLSHALEGASPMAQAGGMKAMQAFDESGLKPVLDDLMEKIQTGAFQSWAAKANPEDFRRWRDGLEDGVQAQARKDVAPWILRKEQS